MCSLAAFALLAPGSVALAEPAPSLSVLPSETTLPPALLEATAALEGRVPEPPEGGFGACTPAAGTDSLWALDSLDDPRPGYTEASQSHPLPGSVALLQVEVAGPVPATEATLALKRRASLVRSCYHRALWNTPALAGEAAFTFEVSPQGQVQGTPRAPTLDEALSACILARLDPMELSPQAAASQITTTWRLSPM
jgi:hypothetical protein